MTFEDSQRIKYLNIFYILLKMISRKIYVSDRNILKFPHCVVPNGQIRGFEIFSKIRIYLYCPSNLHPFGGTVVVSLFCKYKHPIVMDV